MLADAGLPQVGTLLGDEAPTLLALALEPAGIEVLAARPSQVRYEPGHRLVVRYATTVRERGRERVDTTVAVARRGHLPRSVAVLEGPGGHTVGVWRYPEDPWLPGLRTLAQPEGARRVLAQIGLTARRVQVRPVVYRPGQRAVLRITADGHEVYAKLLRPGRAAHVHRAHEAFGDLAPVPRSFGWSEEHGLVVLESLAGDRLAERLSGGAGVPPPGALLALLDRIADAEVVSDTPGPRGFAHHLRLLRAVVPQTSDLVDEVAAAAVFEAPADRTIHGDFYEGQILVRGPEVAGLLDVDTARAGNAVEDLATLLAHLDALARVRPRAAARIRVYRREVERHALRRVDRHNLDAAVAGVLLGLATGPFRLQEAGWPARTLGWLRLARAALRSPGRQGAGAGTG